MEMMNVMMPEVMVDPMAVTKSELHPESIEKFKMAVDGLIPYNSLDVDIAVWEDFLMNWLEGEAQIKYENWMEYLKLLYHTFRDSYGYDGILWRGIELEPWKTFEPKELACYSSNDEVALCFAGKSHQYGVSDEWGQEKLLIEVYVKGALALDELLEDLCMLTMNGALLEQIDEKLWECEKICPQPEYVLGTSR